jgi:hypothetical protein
VLLSRSLTPRYIILRPTRLPVFCQLLTADEVEFHACRGSPCPDSGITPHAPIKSCPIHTWTGGLVACLVPTLLLTAAPAPAIKTMASMMWTISSVALAKVVCNCALQAATQCQTAWPCIQSVPGVLFLASYLLTTDAAEPWDAGCFNPCEDTGVTPMCTTNPEIGPFDQGTYSRCDCLKGYYYNYDRQTGGCAFIAYSDTLPGPPCTPRLCGCLLLDGY